MPDNNRFNINYPDNYFSNHCREIDMIIGNAIVPFITDFVDALDKIISQQRSQKRLSKRQKYWIAFCLMAILATKSVCWAKFERVSLG